MSTDSATTYSLDVLLKNNNTVHISSQFNGHINNIYNKILSIISQNKSNSNSKKSNLNSLRELKSLLDEGIITEEDFNKKKKQLLNI